ncbi:MULTISPECIES: preprotein translocase subunit YajC [Psychroflexus]|jgi:preprotein translocase subunit YajC|uniref:Sec translocon accessory complex subunit YajC n=2 Tax=Psychroflexus TaxID=83612 RepID=A0ABN1KD64_9FLAO|nr:MULTISPECIES: preprotein translocase subunit YajC [Psychroflexus]MBZ9620162.1 preprotein translocase subunit YajC [Psychroflexus lacisalsi]MBZ9778925.1 preprotein translocase subunit YajC [Psychroflexus longus]
MDQIGSLLPLVLIFVVLYFFMIRPQMKKQKKEKSFIESIKRGDKIITKSGLHGKVADISEKLDAVILETGSGKMTFDKSALSYELTQKINAPVKEKKEEKK